MLKIAVFFSLFVFQAHAGDMVDIFGAANTPSGKQNKAHFSFEDENPPVFVINKNSLTPETKAQKQEKSVSDKPKEIHQLSAQNPKPFSISPEAEKNEIENTLYEGGNRIYDVQSFPIDDIKTITEPNINPTISTYPEY